MEVNPSATHHPLSRAGLSTARARSPTLSDVERGDAVIRIGHRGDEVRRIQAQLNAQGAEPPLVEDGIFGPLTQAALSSYQEQHGLRVDGIFGAESMGALLPAPANPWRSDGFERTTGHERSGAGTPRPPITLETGQAPKLDGASPMKAGTMLMAHRAEQMKITQYDPSADIAFLKEASRDGDRTKEVLDVLKSRSRAELKVLNEAYEKQTSEKIWLPAILMDDPHAMQGMALVEDRMDRYDAIEIDQATQLWARDGVDFARLSGVLDKATPASMRKIDAAYFELKGAHLRDDLGRSTPETLARYERLFAGLPSDPAGYEAQRRRAGSVLF